MPAKTPAQMTTMRRPMRAVVHDSYGPPDVLRLEEVERPVPEEDEVLVRIHATTVKAPAHMRSSSACGRAPRWRASPPA
jgi:Zn-dependent alcohol dehydrogenase